MSEQNETNVTQKQESSNGAALLAVLIAGVIIASTILISVGKQEIAIYVIAAFFALITLFLVVRLCVDVHAIRKMLEEKR